MAVVEAYKNTSPRKTDQMIDQQFHWGLIIRSAVIRVIHLLIWTTLIAGLFATSMYANVRMIVTDRDRGVLEFWVMYMNYEIFLMIVAVPFAFIVSDSSTDHFTSDVDFLSLHCAAIHLARNAFNCDWMGNV